MEFQRTAKFRFIVMSIIIVGGITYLSYPVQKPKVTGAVQIVEQEEVKQTITYEPVKSWINSHAQRISEHEAALIMTECFNYPHPILLISLIEAESEFTPTAISSKGAIGLGQIMYDIHKKDLEKIGIKQRKDLFNIEKNIKATSFVLQMMMKKDKGDVVKALHSYLGGKDGKYTNRIFTNYVCLSIELELANEKVMPHM